VYGEKITQISVVSIPMLTKFRGLSHREALIFKGTRRWAEFSPFIEYSDQEASNWLAAALSFANQDLPKLHRESVGVNATLPAVSPDQVEKVLSKFGEFSTVKNKVAETGQTLVDDIARVLKVNSSYPNVRIRLDANGNFSPEQALELLAQIPLERLDYFEQPCASIDELVELRTTIKHLDLKVLIAADESIRKASDPMEVAQRQAADVVMLKVQPLGGIERSLEIARETGLRAVVSSALETSIGLSQGAYLAAALPELEFDCGLGTLSLMESDITLEPLKPVAGRVTPREIEPDAALLQKYQASPERTKWWLERLERCFGLLES
jgi:O-succinylbenzoate synthase